MGIENMGMGHDPKHEKEKFKKEFINKETAGLEEMIESEEAFINLVEKPEGEGEKNKLDEQTVKWFKRNIAELQHQKGQREVEIKYEIERLKKLTPEERQGKIESNIKEIEETTNDITEKFNQDLGAQKYLNLEGVIAMNTKHLKRENEIMEAIDKGNL